jgi:hypothetical protein
MDTEVYEAPTFWAEPAGEIVLGRLNENDADKEKWFEGDKQI